MRVFFWSDSHYPFHSRKAYIKNLELIRKGNYQAVVHAGDLKDKYMFGGYPKSFNVFGPKQEMDLAHKFAVQMWKDIKKAAPKAKLFQLIGNHDTRTQRMILERCPQLESLYSLEEDYKFPGVITLKSHRDHLELDNIVYIHGFLSKSLDHALKRYGKPVVHGHSHKPGIYTFGSRIWTMDCGHTADVKYLPLQYTDSKLSGWRMASGEVIDRVPRLFFLE